MRTHVRWLVVVFAFLAGCPSAHLVPAEPLAPGESASALLGPAGGTLEVGSLDLVIPAGALAAETEIRVIVTATPTPGAFTGYSPVVRFEPDGLSFAAPVEVRVPFEGDAALATVFWSQRDGDAYVPRPTRIEDGYAIASTTHFSSAFVGTACSGSDCCDAANGELDLLLVVDNSNSMTQEQALLALEIPRLARVLASGDRDGDGLQDFPALASIHVGVVSTDLGSGPIDAVPSCDSGWGDDGILRTTSRGVGTCAPSYPSGVIAYEDGGAVTLDDFVSQVSCVADIGTGGCGFEQQLEAALIALSPMSPTAYTAPGYIAPTLAGGRPSHGDGANDGLLRDASILAVLELTDETDSSAADLSIFDPEAPMWSSVPLNLRGTGASAAGLHPVSRYVDGLLALRTSPANLIFGAVAGVPVALVPDPGNVDYGAVLAAPEMALVPDPAGGLTLVPACDSSGGVAFPAVRIVETAAGIDAAGGSAVIGSICDTSFEGVIDALVDRIVARASGVCE